MSYYNGGRKGRGAACKRPRRISRTRKIFGGTARRKHPRYWSHINWGEPFPRADAEFSPAHYDDDAPDERAAAPCTRGRLFGVGRGRCHIEVVFQMD
jgi:hypothetical protein